MPNFPSVSSLRGRFLILLLGLTALPALLIGSMANRTARQTAEDLVVAQLTSVSDVKQEQIITWLESRKSDARLMADNFLNEEHFTEIIDPNTNPERGQAFAGFLIDNMLSLQKSRRGYSEIMYLDTNGEIILSTNQNRIGQVLSNYPVISGTLNAPTGEYVHDIHRSEENGQLEMAFGHVLHEVDLNTNTVLEAVNGLVVIRVRMDETIYQIIKELPGLGNTGEILLARTQGEKTVFIGPLRFDANPILTFSIPRASPNARPAHLGSRGEEGLIRTPDYRGVQVLAAYRNIPDIGWGFVVKQDLAEAFTPVKELNRQWLSITALVLIAAVVAAVSLGRALSNPLGELVAAAQNVSSGDLDTEITIYRDDEIGVLSNALRSMLSAIRQNHEDLKAHGEELENLFNLSRSFLGTLNSRDILKVSLHYAIAGTRTDAGAILLADSKRELIVIKAVLGLPEEILEQRFPIDSHTAPGFALSQRKPIKTSNLPDETRFNVPPFIEELGVLSNLAVPMIAGNQAIGALVVDAYASRTFTEDEIRVAQSIANQTAVALERARLFNDLGESYDRTLDALVTALDARDNETEGHSQRVVAYTIALAERMGIREQDLPTIRRGALLHDIGKIGIPDGILHKPGPLTEEEWAVMRKHPGWGKKILEGIPFLESAAGIVFAHHERWDGSGYPKGVAGDEIPRGARIFSVADTFDAITSDRPYRKARSYEVAQSEIRKGLGSQFEPRVVEAFLEIPPSKWARLRAETLAADLKIMPSSYEEVSEGVRLQHYELLNKIIRATTGSLDLQETLDDAAKTIVDNLSAVACGIFLYNPRTDKLYLKAHHNLPERIQQKFSSFPVAGFHNEVVVREACNRLINHISEVDAFVNLNLPIDHPELGQYLCVPLTAKDDVMGIMGVFGEKGDRFLEEDQALYRAIGDYIGLSVHNARLHEIVQKKAVTDSLTGAYNRRYLDDFLERELQRCQRYEQGVSLIIADIDHFKDYNDAHGHLAGDEVLRSLVKLLQNNARASDLVVRYGGEEFVIVLPQTDAEGAFIAAEKFRKLIEKNGFPHQNMTISLGIAHLDCREADDITAEDIISLADKALYQAKKQGGNRTVVNSSPPDNPFQ